MRAHLDAVTTLAVSPSGTTLVSGGHDCSIRFWDLASSGRSCVHEVTSHRRKGQEGVLDVEWWREGRAVASGGADGVVKVIILSVQASARELNHVLFCLQVFA